MIFRFSFLSPNPNIPYCSFEKSCPPFFNCCKVLKNSLLWYYSLLHDSLLAYFLLHKIYISTHGQNMHIHNAFFQCHRHKWKMLLAVTGPLYTSTYAYGDMSLINNSIPLTHNLIYAYISCFSSNLSTLQNQYLGFIFLGHVLMCVFISIS